MLLLLATGIIAQDTSIVDGADKPIKETSPVTWFSQPWIWILGLVVVVIIIYYYFRGSKSYQSKKNS
jgi:hypothetical protein